MWPVPTRQCPPYLIRCCESDRMKEKKQYTVDIKQQQKNLSCITLRHVIFWHDGNISMWYFVRSRDRNVLCWVTDVLIGVEHWAADTTKMIFLAPGHFIDFSSRLGLRLCISLTLSMRLSYCHLVTPSPHCPPSPPSIEWNKYKPFSASQDPMFFVREVYHCFLVTITIDPC